MISEYIDIIIKSKLKERRTLICCLCLSNGQQKNYTTQTLNSGALS